MNLVNRRNGTNDAIVQRALGIGLDRAAQAEFNRETELLLNATQEKMVIKLANVLGMSVESVLNASVLYALHVAKVKRLLPCKLAGFPRRFNGRAVQFTLGLEASAKLREADMLDHVAGCALTGLKMIHDRTMKIVA